MIAIFHIERDSVWAESPDLPGFTACADTFEECSRLLLAYAADPSSE